MTRTNLTSGSDAASRSSYTTGGFAPAADSLLLAFVVNASAGLLPPVPAIPTATGNGLTWETVETGIAGPGGNHRLTCLRAMRTGAAPAPGALTLAFAGQPQALCGWSVFEYDNVDTTGANGSGAVTQHPSGTAAAATTLTVPLAPFGDPANNLAVGAIMLAAVHPVTTGSGFTEIDVQSPNTGLGQSATLQTQDRAGAAAGVEWSWTGAASNAFAIALEVKAAVTVVPVPAPAPADGAEQLARKFEPILFFDRSESFFPSDAKRYVENAALWIAKGPVFDSKSSWGGSSGQPFPRQPAVPAGGIRTEDDGQPDYIGAPVNHDSGEIEHFLEFGGWIDTSGVAQPHVTATSTNPYADRGVIQDRYTNEPKLADSQFWYHAELFDTARLRSLAATVAAPDLLKVVDTFTNPALLCYYFFFPAHVQPPDPACTNVEAREFACFAGEWGGVTLLLERADPGEEYHPSFVGFTGSRTPGFQDGNGNWVRRPQSFDDEQRSNLKVEPWRSAGGVQVPELTEGHPTFYVSLGTHSIYLDPGPHPVDPFLPETGPAKCGTASTGTLDLPQTSFPSAGVLVGKLIASGPLGFFGWIAEITFGTGKITNPPADKVPDDQAPAAGMGRVVHPVGVVVPNAGVGPQPWRSAQGAMIDGRRYDFLVDRTRQAWWPSDDQRSGYRGRWGQQVEHDEFPSNLRSGMRFPALWKMFLLAIEDGRSTKQLP